MRVLALVCVVLFSSGCLVDSDRKDERDSKALIDVGGGQKNSFVPWSRCERLLEAQGPVNKANDRSKHSLTRLYRHKNSCVSLYLGLYKKHHRYRMDGQIPAFQPSSWKDGDLNKTLSFMEGRGITCKERNGKLSLVFPVLNYGHEDYASIDLECASTTERLQVRIGLDDDLSPRKLAITMEHFRKNDMPTVFHAFDTNSAGVIKKHVKVVGDGGEKEVMLDSYKTR